MSDEASAAAPNPGAAAAGGEQLFKVLVLGDYGVGKTSIIRRYTEGTFSPNYKLTIGVDFALKNIERPSGEKIALQLWDIAGHERFGHMTHVYYKYAIAAIIVFDLGRPATFESVAKWHQDLKDKVMLANGKPVPVILLANKSDLSPDVDDQKYNNYIAEKQFKAWYKTSAKNDDQINEAMDALVEEIEKVAAENNAPIQPDDTDVVNLENTTSRETPMDQMKKMCGCST